MIVGLVCSSKGGGLGHLSYQETSDSYKLNKVLTTKFQQFFFWVMFLKCNGALTGLVQNSQTEK